MICVPFDVMEYPLLYPFVPAFAGAAHDIFAPALAQRLVDDAHQF